MAKPICVIYYSPYVLSRKGEAVSISEMNRYMQDKFEDYHVLAIPSNASADGSVEEIRLEVFHEKDITELEVGQLRKLILNEFEQIKK